jgi:hypothetical protein
MGELLRTKISEQGWLIHNQTDLPVICFTDRAGRTPCEVESFANALADLGGWVTTVRLSNGVSALRAGISNYRTEEEHLDLLIRRLKTILRK